MKPAEEIIGLLRERESQMEPARARMRALRDAYNGDVVVPLPELDDSEQVAVANLVAQGLDQTAMRISSVMPDVIFPPTAEHTKAAQRKASIRRRAVLGWWQQNRMDLKLGRRARHLIGYASSTVSLRFNSKTGSPEWIVRDPLTSFPSPLFGPDDLEPYDCIFSYERTLDWLKDRYPEASAVLRDGKNKGSDVFELVEYLDGEETVLVAVGKSPQSSS